MKGSIINAVKKLYKFLYAQVKKHSMKYLFHRN